MPEHEGTHFPPLMSHEGAMHVLRHEPGAMQEAIERYAEAHPEMFESTGPSMSIEEVAKEMGIEWPPQEETKE